MNPEYIARVAAELKLRPAQVAATAELMDAASLRVAQNLATVVPALVGLNVEAHTALLQ